MHISIKGNTFYKTKKLEEQHCFTIFASLKISVLIEDSSMLTGASPLNWW